MNLNLPKYLRGNTQRIARWLRQGFGRKKRVTSHHYQPDFSQDLLLKALGLENDPAQESSERHIGELPEAGTVARAVHAARSLFGPRFFVHPDTVPELWGKLGEDFPDWRKQLIGATQRDAETGLPIYADCGPKMDSQFPWSSLEPGPGADGMYPKRPHRFAFAPRHALASLHDPDAVQRLYGMLRGWMRTAREARSPYCYDSNLGVIQRILALSWCWAFLAGNGDDANETKLALEWMVLSILLADIRFLEPRLGNSAPNNHLLADRFAAWYISRVFPEFLGGARDSEAEHLWCDELIAQTYPDGSGFEHSAHYHEFASEMGAAYLLLCRRQGVKPDSGAEERIQALLRFQAALSGPEAIPLMIGNGVEDTLFPMDPGEGWCAGSLRELYRNLFFPDLQPAPVGDSTVVRAFWLLGGQLAEAWPARSDVNVAPEVFQNGGFYVLPDADGGRLVFRTGPAPGERVAPGHMHADLQSVYFSVHGCPMLVDAGTYTYRLRGKGWAATAPDWRAYLAGPKAHNGLAIRDCDPLGELTGDFRRAGGGAASVDSYEISASLVLVESELTGAGLYSGARRSCIHVRGEYWLIVNLPPPGLEGCTAGAWYGLQFSSQCQLTGQEQRAVTAVHSAGATMTLGAGGEIRSPDQFEGSVNPLGGWVSRRYGAVEQAPQLRYPVTSAGPSVFAVRGGRQGAASEPPTIAVVKMGDALAVRVCWHDAEDILLYDPSANPETLMQLGPISFRGRCAWTRTERGRPTSLRWLHGHRFSWGGEAGFDLDLSGDNGEYSFGGGIQRN